MRWRKVEPSSSLRRFEAIAFLPRRQTLHRSRCWMVTWVWRHVANMQARRVSSSSNKLFEHITSTICNWQRFIWINTELNVDDKWRRPTDPAECVIHSRAAFECALADFVARFFFWFGRQLSSVILRWIDWCLPRAWFLCAPQATHFSSAATSSVSFTRFNCEAANCEYSIVLSPRRLRELTLKQAD